MYQQAVSLDCYFCMLTLAGITNGYCHYTFHIANFFGNTHLMNGFLFQICGKMEETRMSAHLSLNTNAKGISPVES